MLAPIVLPNHPGRFNISRAKTHSPFSLYFLSREKVALTEKKKKNRAFNKAKLSKRQIAARKKNLLFLIRGFN